MSLNQDGEEEVEKDPTLNRNDGDENEEEEDIDFEDEEEVDEEDEDVLAYLEKSTGKKFTKEGLVKTLKQMDIAFAKKGEQKKEEKKVEERALPLDLDERLLRAESKESVLVMEEMKKVAKKTGQTLDSLWNDKDGYFQNKAQFLLEKEAAKNRMKTPTGTDGIATDEEKKNSERFMRDLPPGFTFGDKK